ncbi:MAG: YdbL family protein [Gammaproteobacteria bacterium]|nr:YdbL family protein [Gammaproteobacteria bacterium]
MRALKLTIYTGIILLLVACVTINIYFPAAQAEAAAERIVDDILGKPQEKPDPGASLPMAGWERFAGSLLNLIIPQAQAAQPDFNVDSPQIRKLQATMKQRNLDLKGYYASGAVGFTHDAQIALRDQKVVPLKERARVTRLIDDENRDRNALYRAIAAANGHPEWESDVRATFARTWSQKAEKGWWYQPTPGNWKQR